MASQEQQWRVELHAHSNASEDSLASPSSIIATCKSRAIERIAITDHNTIRGALEAKAIDPQRVIISEEILTTAGELLGYFLTSEIPAGLSPMETIQELRRQGAVISVSHPFDTRRKGHWKVADLLAILPYVDAIEGFNARCMIADANQQALAFASQHDKPITVGSDAHATLELGQSVMLMSPFSGPASFRSSLTTASHVMRMSGLWVHFLSRFAVWVKILLNK